MYLHSLAAVSFFMNVLAVLWGVLCVLLILVVLLQKGRGGGLSGAFGGLGAGGLFGTKTGDFLTWVTIGLTVLFLSMAVFLGLFYKPMVTEPEPGAGAPMTAPAESTAPGGLGEQPGTAQPGAQPPQPAPSDTAPESVPVQPSPQTPQE